jgi:hypothetical protein
VNLTMRRIPSKKSWDKTSRSNHEARPARHTATETRNISRKARKGRKAKKLISELGVLGVSWREIYPNPTGLRYPINLRKSRKLTGILVRRSRRFRIFRIPTFVFFVPLCLRICRACANLVAVQSQTLRPRAYAIRPYIRNTSEILFCALCGLSVSYENTFTQPSAISPK